MIVPLKTGVHQNCKLKFVLYLIENKLCSLQMPGG